MKQLLVQRLIKELQDSDERFQLLLIGFFNILDDHKNKRSTMEMEKYDPLLKLFSSAQANAKMVLCEIRDTLHKLGAEITVLNPDNIPSSKTPNSNFYDWVIYREYINQLEHINEIVDVILKQINPNPQQ